MSPTMSLLKSGPGNRGRSACGPTHVARLEFPRETGLATELMNKVIDDAHRQAEKENLSDEDYFKKVYTINNSEKHLNNG